MAWLVLILAGVFEIGWAVGLKYNAGFTRLTPALLTLASMALSMLLLGWTLRSLPLGTAYAAWTGIGVVGTATAGILMFDDPPSLLRLGCIGLVLAGVVGLKLLSPP
jgi:quaternary ammonium compound-resistance protein SugE